MCWSAETFWIERRAEWARRWRTYHPAVEAAGWNPGYNDPADVAHWRRMAEAYARACTAIGAVGESDPVTGLLY